jgi:hypothetical protein
MRRWSRRPCAAAVSRVIATNTGGMRTMIGTISIVTHVGETEMMIMIGIITIGHAVTDQILLPHRRDAVAVHITDGLRLLSPRHLGVNPQDGVGARSLAGGRNDARGEAAPAEVMRTRIEVKSSQGVAHRPIVDEDLTTTVPRIVDMAHQPLQCLGPTLNVIIFVVLTAIQKESHSAEITSTAVEIQSRRETVLKSVTEDLQRCNLMQMTWNRNGKKGWPKSQHGRIESAKKRKSSGQNVVASYHSYIDNFKKITWMSG